MSKKKPKPSEWRITCSCGGKCETEYNDAAHCELVRKVWSYSIRDGNGITTFYGPPPKKNKDLPRCSLGGHPTQFLHLFPEVLPYLMGDDLVPSFCSNRCAITWLEIRTGKKWEKLK